MEDFLHFFDMKKNYITLHLEIFYSHTTDWCIKIWGTSEEEEIVMEQDVDMELCFAKAHVALKEWLSENMGGY